MLSEAKHLKHTVRLHSVLDFEILRFDQDDIHWNYFSLLNYNCRNNQYFLVFVCFCSQLVKEGAYGETMVGFPVNRVGEADRAFQQKCSRL